MTFSGRLLSALGISSLQAHRGDGCFGIRIFRYPHLYTLVFTRTHHE